ncbi:MAG: tRNA pseudouridine(55) synthase TruB [Myxococcota bacterium]
MRGFLVFDKPAGITSHDVVLMLRAVTGIKKIGHTGTLDPFATGALPVAIGPATRLIQYLDEDHKVYDALLSLGVATETGDPEGDPIEQADVPPLTSAEIEAACAMFIGEQMQIPPKYSAIKHKGRPLYAYAREGIDVEIPPRPIRIDRITLLQWAPPRLRLRIVCGKGTYIRALAVDLGRALGTVAHLEQLRREESGPFTLQTERTLTAPGLAALVAKTDDWRRALRPKRGEERVPWIPRPQVRKALSDKMWTPMQAVSHLDAVQISEAQVLRVRAGQSPPPPPSGTADGALYALAEGDELIALARRDGARGRLERVMAY